MKETAAFVVSESEKKIKNLFVESEKIIIVHCCQFKIYVSTSRKLCVTFHLAVGIVIIYG